MESRARLPPGRKSNYYYQFNRPESPRQVWAVIRCVRLAVGDSFIVQSRQWSNCYQIMLQSMRHSSFLDISHIILCRNR